MGVMRFRKDGTRLFSEECKNFVWVLKDGGSYEEIRYSIRSVVKYHGNVNIVIIGGKPEWYLGEHHPFPDEDPCPYINVWRKLEYACTLYPFFTYMDDDFFLTEKFIPRHFFNHSWNEIIKKHGIKDSVDGGHWTKVLNNTGDVMPKDAKMHCIHAPLPIISMNFLRISADYPGRLIEPSYVPRQIYCHHEKLFGRPYPMKDMKYHKGEPIKDLPPFFSISDDYFDDVLPMLKEMYPAPSHVETMNVFACDVPWWCFDRIATRLSKHIPLDITKIYSTEKDVFRYNINWIHCFNWRLATRIENANVSSLSIYDHNTWRNQSSLFIEAIEKVDFVCVSSTILKEDIGTHMSIDKPIYVLTDGVDFDTFPVCDKNQGDIRFMWSGRTGIWNMVKRLDDIKECIESTGLNDRFYIQDYDTHPVPHEEMYKIYGDTDVLICFSTNEGTPNPVLEAAACGRFIITTEVGAVRELKDLIPGIIIVKNKEELNDALIFCDENPTHVRQKGIENGKCIRSSDMYDWSKLAKKLHDIYMIYKKDNSH
jgi:glycosyltransferase involved in cell wall biosynthesis